jgi:hypothetical protein
MKNETMRNMAGVLLFYLLIVFGVIALNARMANLPNVSNAITLESNISSN